MYLTLFICTLEGAFNCHQLLPLKYWCWQICQMQYCILLASTTISDTILFQLIIAKLPSQKVCFGDLVRIHTCIMLDLVGTTRKGCKRAPQNIKSQGYLTCRVGENTYQLFAPYWLQIPTKSSMMHVWILTRPPKETFCLSNLAMINWNNIVSDIIVGANNI